MTGMGTASPIPAIDAKIIHGDCLDVLATLDERPRLIFADSPYNIGVDYGNGSKADRLSRDEFRGWLRERIAACARVLADDGSLWWMMGQQHQAAVYLAMEDAGLYFRNTITWHETFGVQCQRKFALCSRPIHYFTKHPTRFVFNADAVRVPSDRQLTYNDKRANPAGKVPGDVWKISRVCGSFGERIPGFPTQLPLELLRIIVAVATDPGDLVLDPFSGSATTGVAAVEAGRRYIGIERDENFAAKSEKRLRDVTEGSLFA